jgi:hypothetical protein
LMTTTTPMTVNGCGGRHIHMTKTMNECVIWKINLMALSVGI